MTTENFPSPPYDPTCTLANGEWLTGYKDCDAWLQTIRQATPDHMLSIGQEWATAAYRRGEIDHEWAYKAGWTARVNRLTKNEG